MHILRPAELIRMLKRWIHTKLVLTIGIALGVACLISNGPLIQETLFAFFDVTQWSLYESVIPDGIALDRGPRHWLLQSFEAPWVITGIVAATIAVQTKSWRGMLIALGVTVAGVLTVLDLAYGVAFGQITVDEIIANIVANSLGGLVVSAVFFLVLWTSLFVRKAVGLEDKLFQTVTASTAIMFGFGISLFLYITIATFLQPMEVKARVIAKLPAKGVIGRTYEKGESSMDRNRFRFTGQRTKVENVALNGARGLDWEWMRSEQDTEFTVTVYAVDGCYTLDQFKDLGKGTPIKEISNTERLHITGDGFFSNIVLDGMQIGIEVDRGRVSQFWVAENGTGSGVDLTEFVTGETTIAGNTKGDLAILVTTPTARHDDITGAMHGVSKVLRLEINDEKVPLVFKPKMSAGNEVNIKCRYLEGKLNSTREKTYEDVVLAGIYAKIKRTRMPQGYWPRVDGKYRFMKASGWFRRRGLSHEDMSAVGAEGLGMIVIESPIHELFVDGESYEIPTRAGFRGHGKIRATYNDAGGLVFSGTLHAAWLEGRRLNLTRWERWTLEEKLAILAAIVSIGSGLATMVYRTRNVWGIYMGQCRDGVRHSG